MKKMEIRLNPWIAMVIKMTSNNHDHSHKLVSKTSVANQGTDEGPVNHPFTTTATTPSKLFDIDPNSNALTQCNLKFPLSLQKP